MRRHQGDGFLIDFVDTRIGLSQSPPLYELEADAAAVRHLYRLDGNWLGVEPVIAGSCFSGISTGSPRAAASARFRRERDHPERATAGGDVD